VKKSRTLLSALLLFSSATVISGQETEVIQTNEKFTIHSSVLKEERTVLVRVPPGYGQGSQKYPVVYLLDGNTPRITLMTGMIANLVESEFAPEMIVVSIVNTVRPRDMTPTAIATMPAGGGADNFLKFLETELMPRIEKEYRVQPYNILVGHSLSGLLVAYAFVSRPDLFNAYLAASPAYLQWDSNLLVRRGELSLPRTTKQRHRTLVLAMGDEPEFLPGFNDFRALLERLKLENVDYEIVHIPGENHWSTNAEVLNRGLRRVWHAWKAPSEESSADVSFTALHRHYEAASARYGYGIPIPEPAINRAGLRLLERGKTQDALSVFGKSTTLYPNSANAFNNLATAFERNGQLENAKQNFERALTLAEKAGSSRFSEVIRENLKRVSQKGTGTNLK